MTDIRIIFVTNIGRLYKHIKSSPEDKASLHDILHVQIPDIIYVEQAVDDKIYVFANE